MDVGGGQRAPLTAPAVRTGAAEGSVVVVVAFADVVEWLVAARPAATSRSTASAYSLPIGPAKPKAAQLKLEHRFAAGELPDGIAFGEDGDLFVSMASPAAPGVTILRPDGSDKARIRIRLSTSQRRSTAPRTSRSTARDASS